MADNTAIIQEIILKVITEGGAAVIQDLKNKIKDLQRERDKIDVSTKKGRQEYEKTNKELQTQKQRLGDINKASKDMVTSTGKVATETKKTATETKKIGANIGVAFKNATSLNKMFSRMAFVTTAMLSYKMLDLGKKIVSSLINNTIKWEEEMSKIFSLLDKNEDVFRNILSEDVLRLMKVYGQDLEKSVRAVYDILSARFEPVEISIISEAAAKLAIAEFADIKVATDILTTVLNSFNLEATESNRIINLLSQTVTDAKSTLELITPNFGKIAASASALNLSLKDTVALFSLMTIKGLKTDVSITAIRQLMYTLAAPTEKAKKAMKLYGVELDLASIQAGGFTKILEELKGANTEFLFTLVKTRRGAQALLPLLDSGAEFLEILKNQTDDNTEAFDKFEERAGITKIAVDKLKNSFFLLGKSVGEDFNPYIKAGAEMLTEFNESAAGFKDTEIVKAFGKILTIVASLAVITGGIGLSKWLFSTAPLKAFTGQISKMFTFLLSLSKKGSLITYFLLSPTELADISAEYISVYIEQEVAAKELNKVFTGMNKKQLENHLMELGLLSAIIKDEKLLIEIEEKRSKVREKLAKVTAEGSKERFKVHKKFDNIGEATKLYDAELLRLNAEEETVETLKEKINITTKYIAILKANGSEEDAINGIKKEQIKLEDKLYKALITRSRESLDYVLKMQEETELGFAGLKEAEGLLQIIATADGIDTLYARLNKLYVTTNMSRKEFEELLKVIQELEKKFGDVGEAKLSWKNILGIPDFQTEADAIAYAEQQLADTIMDIQNQILQHQLDIIEKRKESQLEALEEEMDMYREHVSGAILTESHRAIVMNHIKEEEEKRKKAIEDEAAKDMADQKKKNAKYEAGIDLARGLIGIWATQLATKPIFGLVQAGILSAMLIAVYGAQMAIIESINYKAKGGKADSHPGRPKGTDTIPAWLTPGEIIIQEPAAKGNEKPLLAANKELARGKSFRQFAMDYLADRVSYPLFSLGSGKYFQTGGVLPSSGSAGGIDMSIMTEIMEEQLDATVDMRKKLASIDVSNKRTSDNTDKMRRFGRGI